MSAEIKTKVKVPPRRRTATIEVELSDGRTVKASVNKGEVRIGLKHRNGYGANDAIVVPRDLDDLQAVAELLFAVRREIQAQDAFLEEQEQAVAA